MTVMQIKGLYPVFSVTFEGNCSRTMAQRYGDCRRRNSSTVQWILMAINLRLTVIKLVI